MPAVPAFWAPTLVAADSSSSAVEGGYSEPELLSFELLLGLLDLRRRRPRLFFRRLLRLLSRLLLPFFTACPCWAAAARASAEPTLDFFFFDTGEWLRLSFLFVKSMTSSFTLSIKAGGAGGAAREPSGFRKVPTGDPSRAPASSLREGHNGAPSTNETCRALPLRAANLFSAKLYSFSFSLALPVGLRPLAVPTEAHLRPSSLQLVSTTRQQNPQGDYHVNRCRCSPDFPARLQCLSVLG